MTVQEFAQSVVGVPFREHGRDRGGWDCWAVVHACYREVFGIALPSYTADYASAQDRDDLNDLIRSQLGDWREVARPAPGDVVLLRVGRHACHVGVVVGPGRMVHVERGTETCIDRYDGPRWGKRMVGIYRHEARNA